MLQVQSLISFLAAAPKACGSSWAQVVVQRKHVGRWRWLCLCCEYLFEKWCGDRKEICLTHWEKLCKVQIILALLFSAYPHSFDFCSGVSSSPVSAEYGSGHTNGYWCMSGKCAGKWGWGLILSLCTYTMFLQQDLQWDDSCDEQEKDENARL